MSERDQENSKPELKPGCADCVTRRAFVGSGVKLLSAVAMTGSVASLVTACGSTSSGSNAGTGIAIANNASGVYTFAFADYPVLNNAGGSIHVSVAATSGTKDLFVTRVSVSGASTVSTVCTHSGCTLDTYSASSQEYTCPCHNSIFNASGSVVQGPAAVALPSYTSTITSTGIEVVIN